MRELLRERGGGRAAGHQRLPAAALPTDERGGCLRCSALLPALLLSLLLSTPSLLLLLLLLLLCSICKSAGHFFV